MALNMSLHTTNILNYSPRINIMNVTDSGVLNPNTTGPSEGNPGVQNQNITSLQELNFYALSQKVLYTYVLPVIIFVGLVGNILSILVFSNKTLRKLSSSVYILAVLSTDTGTLITLLFVWLEVLGYPLNHQPGICRIIVYVTYVCAFLSIWYVVCITVESYITICHPTKIKEMCTLRRARIVTVILLFIGLDLYIVQLVITGVFKVHPMAPRAMCQTLPHFHNLQVVVSYVDSVITLFLPLVVIIVLLILMTVAIIQSIQRKKQRSVKRKDTKNGQKEAKLPQVRVAKMLVVLSVTFVVLTIPSHMFRFKSQFADPTYEMPYLEAFLLLIMLFVNYSNLSTKFFIFFFCSENFRKTLLRTLHLEPTSYRVVAQTSTTTL